MILYSHQYHIEGQLKLKLTGVFFSWFNLLITLASICIIIDLYIIQIIATSNEYTHVKYIVIFSTHYQLNGVYYYGRSTIQMSSHIDRCVSYDWVRSSKGDSRRLNQVLNAVSADGTTRSLVFFFHDPRVVLILQDLQQRILHLENKRLYKQKIQHRSLLWLKRALSSDN